MKHFNSAVTFDFSMITLVLLYYTLHTTHVYSSKVLYGLLILWTVSFLVSVYIFNKDYVVINDFRIFLVGLISASFITLIYLAQIQIELSYWTLAIYLLINICFLMAERFIFYLFRSSRKRRIAVLGLSGFQQINRSTQAHHAWTKLQFIGYIKIDDSTAPSDNSLNLGTLSNIQDTIMQYSIDEIMIVLPSHISNSLMQLAIAQKNTSVKIRIIPDYYTSMLYNISIERLAGIPTITLQTPTLNRFQRLNKRIFDIVVSSILLVLTLPLMGLVALAIKLDSPGPILFQQPRVGENGKIFVMYKFRSMHVGAEKIQHRINKTDDNGNIIHKTRDDPRVTRAGRFIRRFSLDELPQIFNVLKGDMSLVGPRPEMPWMLKYYKPWQYQRFRVPQGITGWWQVNGRSDKPMHLHTEEDLFYIQNYSFWLDIFILLKTVWAVLRGKGAY